MKDQLLTPKDRTLARHIGRLVHTNPFLPERLDCEREILGDEFQDSQNVLSHRGGEDGARPTMRAIRARVEATMGRLLARLRAGERLGPDESEPFQDLALFLLYFRHEASFYPGPALPATSGALRKAYARFLADLDEFRLAAGVALEDLEDPAHLFACFRQLGRAFHQIYVHIIGRSLPAARLRADAWHSIFTRDMRRYRRALSTRMADLTTLIVGPSGTGKELVARAIGLARYLPFDPADASFPEDPAGFRALHVAALSPTLVESELFGHARGAFTGAVEARVGWLEECPPGGSVFLDEVGEIDAAIQVKLLRVLQERTFQRLGESTDRAFQGKILAATNRDLAAEVARGTVRRDFYFRLCSDLVEVPSLRARLDDCPDELEDLVGFLARRVAGPAEAPSLATEVLAWIDRHLDARHPWAGNVRELEQCVRNVMVRGEYQPLTGDAARTLGAEVDAGSLTADELLDRYCALVRGAAGSDVEAARRLGLDRRTVKARAARGRASP